jgi:hypothetical protein
MNGEANCVSNADEEKKSLMVHLWELGDFGGDCDSSINRSHLHQVNTVRTD